MAAENRVYRMRSWERIVSIVLLVFGLVSLLATWGGVLTGRQDAKFLEMMFPIVFSMGAAFFTIGAFRKSVRLTDHTIEMRGLFRHTEFATRENQRTEALSQQGWRGS